MEHCCSVGIKFQFFKMKSSGDLLHNIVNSMVLCTLKYVKRIGLTFNCSFHKKQNELQKNTRKCFEVIDIFSTLNCGDGIMRICVHLNSSGCIH